MSIRDLEEVNFFYRLHTEEWELGMDAARNGKTSEWRECKERMRILSIRLKQAHEGRYGQLKA